MTTEQIEALKGLIRELVRKEIRDMTWEINREYELSYEFAEKIENLERILSAPKESV